MRMLMLPSRRFEHQGHSGAMITMQQYANSRVVSEMGDLLMAYAMGFMVEYLPIGWWFYAVDEQD
eukprot:scaffold707706_cov94-Attheya_sp.AAC.1